MPILLVGPEELESTTSAFVERRSRPFELRACKVAGEVGFEPTNSWLRTRWLGPLAVTPLFEKLVGIEGFEPSTFFAMSWRCSTTELNPRRTWCSKQVSNLRHLLCESSALPLSYPSTKLAESIGLEPNPACARRTA